MSKAGPIVTAISGGLLLLGIILSVVGAGSVASVELADMDSKFLEAGTSTEVVLDGEYVYSIYLSPGSTCDEGFSLEILNSQSGAYFDGYCDEFWDTTDGYVFVGDLDPQPEYGDGYTTQTLTLTANQDSYVADDGSAYESAGLTMLGGGGICCLGLIGLIVGIIMWISMGGKDNHAQQVGFVQTPIGGMQQSSVVGTVVTGTPNYNQMPQQAMMGQQSGFGQPGAQPQPDAQPTQPVQQNQGYNMGTVGMAAAVATTPVAVPVAQTFANPQPTETQTETGSNAFMPPLTDSATNTPTSSAPAENQPTSFWQQPPQGGV
ncbi:MAG: hypothetical protein ACPGAN_03090 [Candidatus Poseidoniaceae archaeon]